MTTDLTTPYPWLDDIIEVHVLKLEQKWIDFERKNGIVFEAKQALIYEPFMNLECITVLEFLYGLVKKGELTVYEYMQLVNFKKEIRNNPIILTFDLND